MWVCNVSGTYSLLLMITSRASQDLDSKCLITRLGPDLRNILWFVIRSTYESDLQHAKISLRNIVSLITNTISDDLTILQERPCVLHSGVAMGWTCPPHLCYRSLLKMIQIPEFLQGRGRGVGPVKVRTSDPRYRLAFAMSVHPTYFDLATPLVLRKMFSKLDVCVSWS